MLGTFFAHVCSLFTISSLCLVNKVGTKWEQMGRRTPKWDPVKHQDALGQKVCKGYRAYVWSVLGDQRFFCNVLKLPHWASHVRWECGAPGKEVCLEKQKFTVASHAEWQTLGQTMKFSTCHMWAVYCSHFIRGILHYACWYEGPGKVASKKPAARLAVIFQKIQGEHKRQEIEYRLTNLRLCMFTDPAKPWSSKASLDVKAAEAKHLLPALLPLVEKMFPDMLAEEQQKSCGMKQTCFCLSHSMSHALFDIQKWLNSCSLEKGIVAKHHTLERLPSKNWLPFSIGLPSVLGCSPFPRALKDHTSLFQSIF